jgi:hypothetical protein
LTGESAYYLIQMPLAPARPELARFIAWVRSEAAVTRTAIGEPADPSG